MYACVSLPWVCMCKRYLSGSGVSDNDVDDSDEDDSDDDDSGRDLSLEVDDLVKGLVPGKPKE